MSSTSNGNGKFSKCAICGSKNSRFSKNQEAKGLLTSLGLRTLLSNIRSYFVFSCIKNE